jgi:hypothetical protein
MAMVEVTEPELDGLEWIVFCPVSELRLTSRRTEA